MQNLTITTKLITKILVVLATLVSVPFILENTVQAQEVAYENNIVLTEDFEGSVLNVVNEFIDFSIDGVVECNDDGTGTADLSIAYVRNTDYNMYSTMISGNFATGTLGTIVQGPAFAMTSGATPFFFADTALTDDINAFEFSISTNHSVGHWAVAPSLITLDCSVVEDEVIVIEPIDPIIIDPVDPICMDCDPILPPVIVDPDPIIICVEINPGDCDVDPIIIDPITIDPVDPITPVDPDPVVPEEEDPIEEIFITDENTDPTPEPTDPINTDGPEPLAMTGSSSTILAIVAGIFLAIGAALLVVARRFKSEEAVVEELAWTKAQVQAPVDTSWRALTNPLE